MIQFDVAIIGGGVAGYTAGLRCLEAGLKTVLVSQGQSAMHFSSGSIDLLGQTPDHQAVQFPLNAIRQFPQNFPLHPYAKLGAAKVENALNWYQHKLTQLGLPLHQQANGENHFRITPMGTLKATWMSQPFVHQVTTQASSLAFKKIMMVSIEGFRDFQPQIAVDNLAKDPMFKGIEVSSLNVSINAFKTMERNPHELRSIDLSRVLKDESEFNAFADQLMTHASQDDLVVLPAILGNGDGLALMTKLKARTGLNFHEVPTMPPSLLGIRVEETMSQAFIRLGGTLLKGDYAIGGEINETENGTELSILNTKNLSDLPLKAEHYILASGSFFSKGLIAGHQEISEPVFNLDVCHAGLRETWRENDFFTDKRHLFMSFGVETDQHFRPSIAGKTLNNVYCAGAILAHYNPVVEGSGSGVAISTAHSISEAIIQSYDHSSITDNSSVTDNRSKTDNSFKTDEPAQHKSEQPSPQNEQTTDEVCL
ncbi:glycerol-3-phosphate dehydrogenase subunit GlpB [Vibrio genomosp. F6]|uniref:glycerol-3-phosphate dehydrogenase subunit GlpB n=1 Tax=Vibrio genomosp. F6 TaxID=723172 RepID=UPI0010BE166F|nr:glycerol-3-phosphate dehydrogenase subunit GlpB [Vibrio genomosp. F6]TKF18955.1 glycerol-3-phosphate dehydrogenase subunit GlpB [Vibrio genomosp. F6]